MSADSSTHAYNDGMLAICYSHELGQSCYPTLQFIVPGKDVMEEEDELTAIVGHIAAAHKCERVCAYRQLQAISHMTKQLHNRSLDDYDEPAAHTDAVRSSERRVKGPDNVTYIVDLDTGTMKPVLPLGLNDVPLLVLLYDQGAIGAAGSGFTDHLGKIILMKFEKIHRLIRDLKLSMQHSCGGVLLKAQVYSSNLWNYHNKPFGSGF
jgi:hypothetical protein